jgi:hypothetical protein
VGSQGVIVRRKGWWRCVDAMLTIRSYTNQAEASFFGSLLQANGFDAVLLDEESFQGYGGPAIPIRLQVPEEQAAEALAFINTARDEPEVSAER